MKPAPTQTSQGFHQCIAFLYWNDASHAQGLEARKVSEAVSELWRHWNDRTEVLVADTESSEPFSYNHVVPRQVLCVKTHYKYVGRIKPRLFPLDE